MDLNSNTMKNRLKRQQLDGKSIEIKKSWKNVRPTGLEIAIQFGCQNILVWKSWKQDPEFETLTAFPGIQIHQSKMGTMCFGLNFVSRIRDKIKKPIAKIFTP